MSHPLDGYISGVLARIDLIFEIFSTDKHALDTRAEGSVKTNHSTCCRTARKLVKCAHQSVSPVRNWKNRSLQAVGLKRDMLNSI